MTLWELPGRIRDVLSLSAKQVLIVAVASWSLLFIPDSLLTSLGLTGFRSQFRAAIGLTAWISAAWFGALLLYEGWEALSRVVVRVRAGLSWKSYTKDEISGVKWTWGWGSTLPRTASGEAIEAFAERLVPLCPECDANLEMVDDTLRCPRAARHYGRRFRRDHPMYFDEYRDFCNRVAREIVRQARTGGYKQRTIPALRLIHRLSSAVRRNPPHTPAGKPARSQ